MKQRRHWQENIFLLIKEEYRLYLCILISFLFGSMLAAVFVFTMPALTCEELLLYLKDFFQNIRETGTDAISLLEMGLLQNLQNFLFLFLFSVMVVGAPFIAGFATVQGFIHGFTLFFMFKFYGVKTLLFFLCGMLPHYLLLVPCYLFLCVICLRFSLSLLQGRQEFGKKLLVFSGKLLVCYLLVAMAALLQSYVEPLLIRLVSGVFLA